MKILEVLDTFYPSVDGPVNVIVNIAKILKEKGLADVELLVPNQTKKTKIDDIKIHYCASVPAPEGYRAAVPTVNNKVKKIIMEGGYDLIHVHSPFTLGRYIVNLAKKYEIPVLMTIHTKYRDDFERTLKDKGLIKFMMNYIMEPVKMSDFVLSVSNGAAQTLREYGYKGRKIYVVRNGTDMKPAKPNKKLENSIIQEFNLKDKFVFLFVGRIVENKNIQFSLEVLKKLKEKGSNNFKFLIVGSGPYEEELKQLVIEYNLSNNVIFTGKIMDREKLAGIYSAANLFLFPSAFDTCGIVAIEAAANNLPSVMLENTCASELIKNGENGLALQNDTSVWVEEIEKLMQNRNLLTKMKNEVQKSVYVSWDKVVLEYLDFYKFAIDNYIPKSKKQILKETTTKKKRAKSISGIKKQNTKTLNKKKIKKAKKIKKIKKQNIKVEKATEKATKKLKNI